MSVPEPNGAHAFRRLTNGRMSTPGTIRAIFEPLENVLFLILTDEEDHICIIHDGGCLSIRRVAIALVLRRGDADSTGDRPPAGKIWPPKNRIPLFRSSCPDANLSPRKQSNSSNNRFRLVTEMLLALGESCSRLLSRLLVEDD